MGQFTRNELENLSEEEKLELMKKKSDRPSARPMGTIYPKLIKRILDGESPTITVSYHTNKNLSEEEIKSREEEFNERLERHKIFEELRKEINPTFCPKCGRFMKSKLDEKFYRIRKMCFNCVVEYEHQLRVSGKWEQYQTKIITENKISFLKDVKQEIIDYMNNDLKPEYEYVNEDGTIEKWKNTEYENTKKFLEKTLVEVETYIEDLEDYVQELEQELSNVNI
jgi:hypothetical protein